MNTSATKTISASPATKGILLQAGWSLLIFLSLIIPVSQVKAQAVLFDFDNAPIHTSLPISQTVSAITASFTATGQGYSIQDANVLGFTPAGFAGNIIYPNSVILADLLISFDQPITDFSIMYSCQELGCDDAATMRVTAYMNGNLVGTNTKTASVPGTWPVDTLRCSFNQGFDNVVIHYDSPPPTCQDYGVIYLADNMRVTAINTGISNPDISLRESIFPNPVSTSASISFSLMQTENIHAAIYDISGRLIIDLYNGQMNAGEQRINWNLTDAIKDGVYMLQISGDGFFKSSKFIVVK